MALLIWAYGPPYMGIWPSLYGHMALLIWAYGPPYMGIWPSLYGHMALLIWAYGPPYMGIWDVSYSQEDFRKEGIKSEKAKCQHLQSLTESKNYSVTLKVTYHRMCYYSVTLIKVTYHSTPRFNKFIIMLKYVSLNRVRLTC